MANAEFEGLDSEATIEEAIVRYVAGRADVAVEDVDVTENLMTSGLLDSIGMMRLIAELEAGFSVEVPPTDLVPENFRTIKIMASYVFSLRSPD